MANECDCGLERAGCLYPRCQDGEQEECDHIDYDADILNGMATCADCGHRWMQTTDEIAAESARERFYDEAMRREERRARFRAVGGWFRSFLPRRRRAATLDDEIPF